MIPQLNKGSQLQRVHDGQIAIVRRWRKNKGKAGVYQVRLAGGKEDGRQFGVAPEDLILDPPYWQVVKL